MGLVYKPLWGTLKDKSLVLVPPPTWEDMQLSLLACSMTGAYSQVFLFSKIIKKSVFLGYFDPGKAFFINEK